MTYAVNQNRITVHEQGVTCRACSATPFNIDPIDEKIGIHWACFFPSFTRDEAARCNEVVNMPALARRWSYALTHPVIRSKACKQMRTIPVTCGGSDGSKFEMRLAMDFAVPMVSHLRNKPHWGFAVLIEANHAIGTLGVCLGKTAVECFGNT